MIATASRRAAACFVALLSLVACGADEDAPSTSVATSTRPPSSDAAAVRSRAPATAPAQARAVDEPIAQPVGSSVIIGTATMTIREIVEDAPGLWRAAVSVRGDGVHKVVFDGTFTARAADGTEYVGTYSDVVGDGWAPAARPLQATNVGGGPVIFEATDVVEVVYTAVDGDTYVWLR